MFQRESALEVKRPAAATGTCHTVAVITHCCGEGDSRCREHRRENPSHYVLGFFLSSQQFSSFA
jgi:hypothetical protein